MRYAEFRQWLSPRDDKSSHDSLDSRQQMPPAGQAHKENKLGFLWYYCCGKRAGDVSLISKEKFSVHTLPF